MVTAATFPNPVLGATAGAQTPGALASTPPCSPEPPRTVSSMETLGAGACLRLAMRACETVSRPLLSTYSYHAARLAHGQVRQGPGSQSQPQEQLGLSGHQGSRPRVSPTLPSPCQPPAPWAPLPHTPRPEMAQGAGRGPPTLPQEATSQGAEQGHSHPLWTSPRVPGWAAWAGPGFLCQDEAGAGGTGAPSFKL